MEEDSARIYCRYVFTQSFIYYLYIFLSPQYSRAFLYSSERRRSVSAFTVAMYLRIHLFVIPTYICLLHMCVYIYVSQWKRTVRAFTVTMFLWLHLFVIYTVICPLYICVYIHLSQWRRTVSACTVANSKKRKNKTKICVLPASKNSRRRHFRRRANKYVPLSRHNRWKPLHAV